MCVEPQLMLLLLLLLHNCVPLNLYLYLCLCLVDDVRVDRRNVCLYIYVRTWMPKIVQDERMPNIDYDMEQIKITVWRMSVFKEAKQRETWRGDGRNDTDGWKNWTIERTNEWTKNSSKGRNEHTQKVGTMQFFPPKRLLNISAFGHAFTAIQCSRYLHIEHK